MNLFKKLTLLYLLLSCASQAQQLSVKLEDIDLTYLPRVTFNLCATFGGQPLAGIKVSSVSFRENGRVQPVQLVCPDTSVFNSVMLVIDNSGSISSELGAIKLAAIGLVDSLKAKDEAALIRFGSTVTLLQDFTTNRTLLRTAINAMAAGGGTALYAAMKQAVTLLSVRPGKKICITLTDGSDNAGGASPTEIIALAQASNVTMYTIGFGASQIDEQILREIAFQTGGKYYRALGSGSLPSIFNEIALAITSFCCRGEYIASSCTDTLRRIEASITVNNQTARADTTVVSPSRPDTVTVRVISPPEVAPNGSALVYFQIEPKLAKNVMTKFSLRFRYDAQLLSFQPLFAITLGTMTEGQSLSVRSISAGDVEVSGNYLALAYPTGNLFGIRLKGLAADSSRPVPLSILSCTIENGCPVIINTIDDTIDVCQCKKPVVAEVDSLQLVRTSGADATVALRVEGLAPIEPVVFMLTIEYDDSLMHPERLYTSDTTVVDNDIEWRITRAGELQASMLLSSALRDTSGVLCYVVFKTHERKEPRIADWTPVRVKVYQRCCPSPPGSDSGALLINGLCEQIIKKRTSPLKSLTNHPNPIGALSLSGSRTLIMYELFHDADVRLELFDVLGRRIATLRDAFTPQGVQGVSFDAAHLTAGYYLIRLSSGEFLLERMMVVK